MLEEIKQRADRAALYQETWVKHYRSDVTYLLEQNKVLVEALEQIKIRTVQLSQDNGIYNIALEALNTNKEGK